MITSINSLDEQLKRRAARQAAYDALPWYGRAWATAKVRAKSVRVHLHFLRNRVRVGQPWKLDDVVKRVAYAIFVQKFY